MPCISHNIYFNSNTAEFALYCISEEIRIDDGGCGIYLGVNKCVCGDSSYAYMWHGCYFVSETVEVDGVEYEKKTSPRGVRSVI